MPRPSPRLPAAAPSDARCMCSVGRACSSFAPGHAVHLLQARLVAASPGEWVDAVVTHVSPATGEIELTTVADGRRLALWNGAGGADAAVLGDPVAYHPRHHVLSVGPQRFNALRRE